MGNRSTNVPTLQHPTDRIRLDCSYGSVVKESYAHFNKDRLVRSFLFLEFTLLSLSRANYIKQKKAYSYE